MKRALLAAAIATIAATGADTAHAVDFVNGRFYNWCGVDIPGYDVANHFSPDSTSCYLRCKGFAPSFPSNCTAVSWSLYQNGWCWGKATEYKAVNMEPNAAADSISYMLSKAPVVWSKTYDGFDMAGNDIANSRKPNLDACKTECEANAQCFAVTWTDYENGACWFKKRASKLVASAGAQSAYVGRLRNGDALCPDARGPR